MHPIQEKWTDILNTIREEHQLSDISFIFYTIDHSVVTVISLSVRNLPLLCVSFTEVHTLSAVLPDDCNSLHLVRF
mgnify:FL=1